MKTEDSLPFFVCFILRPCLVKIKTQSYDLMLVYQHSPEKQRKKAIQCVGGEYLCVCTCVCVSERNWFIILGNRLTQLCGLASLRFAEQANQLEILAGDDAAVLIPKAAWKQNPRPLQRTLVFSLKAFNWLDEAHPYYGGQYALLKSTDLNVNHI